MLDPYLRLSLDECASVVPVHTCSRIDEKGTVAPTDAATVRGSTEWTACASRPLSFGWDWIYDRRAIVWSAEWSNLGTNLMVIDAQGVDLGPAATQACVSKMMARVRWADVVAQAVGLPRAP